MTDFTKQGLEVAQSQFGFSQLRSHQSVVLDAVGQGQDCLVVVPTGSGKSYCYFLPAMVLPHLVVVISPLVALIRDQERRCRALGVPVAAFYAQQDLDERQAATDLLNQGKAKILLVSPERLARPAFREWLSQLPISMVAIDEAHCISQWGYHFRPEYRKIGEYLEDLPRAPRLALTATATPRVQDDVKEALQLTDPVTHIASFHRANLEQSVVQCGSLGGQRAFVLNAVLNQSGSGIVYAPTRRIVREVHDSLVQAGVRAVAYHGGLDGDQKRSAYLQFTRGTASVVVATSAFGMGIDKRDIRYVYHCGMPGTLEQYVQEMGRAGRDGLPAQCRLFYGPKDFFIQKFMLDHSYPDPHVLKRVFDLAIGFMHDGRGRDEDWLAREIRLKGDFDTKDVQGALSVLYREGALLRLVASEGSAGDWLGGEAAQIIPGHLDGDYWVAYSQKRDEAHRRLRALLRYIKFPKEREAIMKAYFCDGEIPT